MGNNLIDKTCEILYEKNLVNRKKIIAKLNLPFPF